MRPSIPSTKSKPVLYQDDSNFIYGQMWSFIWLSLNISMTLLNKSIFVHFDFPFPVTVSMIHMFFTCLLSYISITCFKYPEMRTLDFDQHKRVAAFSLLFCVNIVLGNLGINLTSVATSQVIRAAIPSVTMVLSYFLLGKNYTRQHIFTIALVVIGVMIATYGDLEFKMLGLVIQITGCILSSFKSVTSSKFLVGFHPLDLAFRMSFYAVIQMFFIAYFMGEISMIRENWDQYATIYLAFALAINGCMAFSLNFSNFMFTKYTSALTVTVSGSVKNVLTIIVSIVLFRTPVSFLNGFGIIITILSATAYNVVCYKHSKDAKKKEVLKP